MIVDYQKIALKKDKITVALLWPKCGGGITSINDLVLGLDKDRFWGLDGILQQEYLMGQIPDCI